jgi:hemerythrin-like domain-containing protein
MALKRHQALQDYSREHHQELLLVWKIREGIKKGIDDRRISDYCVHHFNQLTSPHMKKEETYILSHLPENDKDRIKIFAEHNELRELINKLKTSADKNKLKEFADELEKHVRYEERNFFPRIQNEFPADTLQSMHPAEKKTKDYPDWKDPFWKS